MSKKKEGYLIECTEIGIFRACRALIAMARQFKHENNELYLSIMTCIEKALIDIEYPEDYKEALCIGYDLAGYRVIFKEF